MPIEIDGLPIKNGDFFHGELLNNQLIPGFNPWSNHVEPSSGGYGPAK